MTKHAAVKFLKTFSERATPWIVWTLYAVFVYVGMKS